MDIDPEQTQAQLTKTLITQYLRDHDPDRLAKVVAGFPSTQQAAEACYEVFMTLDAEVFDEWIGEDLGAYSSSEFAIADIKKMLVGLQERQTG